MHNPSKYLKIKHCKIGMAYIQHLLKLEPKIRLDYTAYKLIKITVTHAIIVMQLKLNQYFLL